MAGRGSPPPKTLDRRVRRGVEPPSGMLVLPFRVLHFFFLSNVFLLQERARWYRSREERAEEIMELWYPARNAPVRSAGLCGGYPKRGMWTAKRDYPGVEREGGLSDYRFMLNFDVRDYECDLQGIVNNAVYQNYLEHTRHEFLKTLGGSFATFTSRGINLVVVRIEIDYLYPLRSGDSFWVGLNMERISRLRFGFVQDIYRVPDGKAILKAKVIGAALNESGKPFMPGEIETLLETGIRPPDADETGPGGVGA